MKRRHLLTTLGAGIALGGGVWLAGALRPWPRGADPTLNEVSIRIEGAQRIIRSNGIPDHETGAFPNANNPFSLRAQTHVWHLPLYPEPLTDPQPVGIHVFGVALNGVPFDPAGPFLNGDQRSGWQFDPLMPRIGAHLGVDGQNAHTQPSGAYHYHGQPKALLERLHREAAADGRLQVLVGWAADGYPIYDGQMIDDTGETVSLRSGYRLLSGARPAGVGGSYNGDFIEDYRHDPDIGDLDASNGRYGATPEFPQGTYYYVITDGFPVIPRMFRARPGADFLPPGGGPGPGDLPPGLKGYPDIGAPRRW